VLSAESCKPRKVRQAENLAEYGRIYTHIHIAHSTYSILVSQGRRYIHTYIYMYIQSNGIGTYGQAVCFVVVDLEDFLRRRVIMNQ
jgi:hypothetical protein